MARSKLSKPFNRNTDFSRMNFVADTGKMCLKQKQIPTGFAPFVVEFATAVCAGKQKGGLLLGLSTGR